MEMQSVVAGWAVILKVAFDITVACLQSEGLLLPWALMVVHQSRAVIICECVKCDSTSTYCTRFFPAARIEMQKLKIIQFGSQVECDVMSGKILTTQIASKIRQGVIAIWLVLYI